MDHEDRKTERRGVFSVFEAPLGLKFVEDSVDGSTVLDTQMVDLRLSGNLGFPARTQGYAHPVLLWEINGTAFVVP